MNSKLLCLTSGNWIPRVDEPPSKKKNNNNVVPTVDFRDVTATCTSPRFPSRSCTINRTRGRQTHGSSNRNREPRRTKLAARAAEWFWHAAGYIRFSADATVARGACADIIHACAGVPSPVHTEHTHPYTHTRARAHAPTHAAVRMPTARRKEVKSDEMENTHSERTFHARRVFRLEEETREDRKSHREDYWRSVKDSK